MLIKLFTSEYLHYGHLHLGNWQNCDIGEKCVYIVLYLLIISQLQIGPVE